MQEVLYLRYMDLGVHESASTNSSIRFIVRFPYSKDNEPNHSALAAPEGLPRWPHRSRPESRRGLAKSALLLPAAFAVSSLGSVKKKKSS